MNYFTKWKLLNNETSFETGYEIYFCFVGTGGGGVEFKSFLTN